MIIANIQCLGVFFTVLSLISLCQLLLNLLLSVFLPDTLSLLGSHYSTGLGLIAGFITFPTSIRMKTSQFSPNMSRVYGYTFCFQRLAMVVCGTLHLFSTLASITIFISIKKNWSNIGNNFLQLVKNYHEKIASKILVDDVQFILQCCGGFSSNDWLQGGKEISYLQDPFDNEVNLPFSCCSKYYELECNTQDANSESLNKNGCIPELRKKAYLLLFIEFTLSVFCFLIELTVFFLLKNPQSVDELKSSSSTIKTVFERSKWDDFSNTTDKSKLYGSDSNATAQICPTLHSEVNISFKKSMEYKDY